MVRELGDALSEGGVEYDFMTAFPGRRNAQAQAQVQVQEYLDGLDRNRADERTGPGPPSRQIRTPTSRKTAEPIRTNPETTSSSRDDPDIIAIPHMYGTMYLRRGQVVDINDYDYEDYLEDDEEDHSLGDLLLSLGQGVIANMLSKVSSLVRGGLQRLSPSSWPKVLTLTRKSRRTLVQRGMRKVRKACKSANSCLRRVTRVR